MAADNKKGLGGISFLPLFIFLGLYIGSGVFFSIKGSASPFNQFPRHVALFIAIGVAVLMNKNKKIDDKIEVFSKNAGSSGVMKWVLSIFLQEDFREQQNLWVELNQ